MKEQQQVCRLLLPELLEATYEHVKEYLPDGLRDPGVFMALYTDPATMFYEVGGFGGVFWLSRIILGHKAGIHIVLWDKAWRGKQALARDVIRDLFRLLSLQRLEAFIPTMNKEACTYVEKLGFTLEGILRRFDRYDKQYVDIAVYSLLEEELDGIRI